MRGRRHRGNIGMNEEDDSPMGMVRYRGFPTWRNRSLARPSDIRSKMRLELHCMPHDDAVSYPMNASPVTSFAVDGKSEDHKYVHSDPGAV